MKKFWVMTICILLCCIFTFASAEGYGSAVINGKTADRVHLRAYPSTDAASLGLYFTGTLVTCLSDPSEQWVAVSIGKENGYMMSQYLSVDAAVDSHQPLGLVNSTSGSRVNVRQGPSTDTDVLMTVDNNEPFIVLGETVNKWYCVQSGDTVGYIRSDLLLLTDRIAQGAVTPIPGGAAGSPVVTLVPLSSDDLNVYRAVMVGDAPMLIEDYGQAYLNDWPLLHHDWQPSFPRFAIADMDADGTPEVLIEETFNVSYPDGYIILHAEGGVIYGYELGIRSCKEQKVDGTFSFSSGAADSGFGRISFSGTSYSIINQTYSEGGVIDTYVVDFAPATAEAFRAAIIAQDAKQDVSWIELTPENIDTIFGAQ